MKVLVLCGSTNEIVVKFDKFDLYDERLMNNLCPLQTTSISSGRRYNEPDK